MQILCHVIDRDVHGNFCPVFSKMASSTNCDDLLHDSLKCAASKLKIPGGKFKELQETAIRNVLAGEDLFIALPTGFGKSAIYEAIPLCCDFLRERQYFDGAASASGTGYGGRWVTPTDEVYGMFAE